MGTAEKQEDIEVKVVNDGEGRGINKIKKDEALGPGVRRTLSAST